MRISGGTACGRQLKVPTGVRPSQDRFREALFSMLADRIPECRFLDLFAGSGAIGIEAWSRGAGFVCCVEGNSRVAATLSANVKEIAGGGIKILRMQVAAFLRATTIEGGFHIVFADPPYGLGGDSIWLQTLLEALRESHIMEPDGIFVMEQRKTDPLQVPDDWELLRDRTYGDSRLLMFARKASTGETNPDGVRLMPTRDL